MNFFEATRILKNYCEEQENDCYEEDRKIIVGGAAWSQ